MNMWASVLCQFIQLVIQERIENATVVVKFGEAKDKKRRFDTDHDGHRIVFIIDPVYLHDPKEVDKVWKQLRKWVAGWNIMEHTGVHPSEWRGPRGTNPLADWAVYDEGDDPDAN